MSRSTLHMCAYHIICNNIQKNTLIIMFYLSYVILSLQQTFYFKEHITLNTSQFNVNTIIIIIFIVIKFSYHVIKYEMCHFIILTNYLVTFMSSYMCTTHFSYTFCYLIILTKLLVAFTYCYIFATRMSYIFLYQLKERGVTHSAFSLDYQSGLVRRARSGQVAPTVRGPRIYRCYPRGQTAHPLLFQARG